MRCSGDSAGVRLAEYAWQGFFRTGWGKGAGLSIAHLNVVLFTGLEGVVITLFTILGAHGHRCSCVFVWALGAGVKGYQML